MELENLMKILYLGKLYARMVRQTPVITSPSMQEDKSLQFIVDQSVTWEDVVLDGGISRRLDITPYLVPIQAKQLRYEMDDGKHKSINVSPHKDGSTAIIMAYERGSYANFYLTSASGKLDKSIVCILNAGCDEMGTRISGKGFSEEVKFWKEALLNPDQTSTPKQ